MGKKLSPERNELYKRTDEVLFYLWNPIGVKDAPEARDEYLSYLPIVFETLVNGRSDGEIKKYLLSVESERMELSSNNKNAEMVVDILKRYKDQILE